MHASKNQKGVLHLGILAIFVLTIGLFAASRLASNPDLTFFNISEEAKGVDEKKCQGCDGSYLLSWKRYQKVCTRKKSPICNIKRVQPTNKPERLSTPTPIPSPVKSKVLLLIYNPTIESHGNEKLSKVKGWNDPVSLTNTFINSVKSVSSGLVNYEIVETIELDGYPVKMDGFAYTDESYLSCTSDSFWCHQPDLANYQKMILDAAACQKRNNGTIDELWIWGGPYFGYWESNLAGPNSFWYNSSPTTGTDCTKLLPIMGFNYERGEAEMFEDLAHRVEATMSKVYGSWSKDENHSWDKFALLDVEKPKKGGCGNAHNAVNSTTNTGYDRGNPRKVISTCEDFLNYPNLTGVTTEISCQNWGCTSLGYLKWWFSHLPKQGGENNGKLNNWWDYLVNPQKAI